MSILRVGKSLPVLGFDIENRPAAYWYPGETTAEITAICWKWRHEDDVHLLLLQRNNRWQRDGLKTTVDTRAAMRLISRVLGDAGIVYGHNIRGHDLPIIQGTLERLALPKLPSLLTCDTLKDYPKRKAKAASLEVLADELDLGADKKHMGVAQWEQSNRLEPEGLEETRERVVGDVLLQERLRDRLLELDYLAAPRRWTP